MTSKPYVEAINHSPETTQTALDWAKYLGETFGTSGALSSLRYYERMGWITPAVRRRVTDYLKGLSLGEINNKKYNDPEVLSDPLDSLSGTPFSAHARSLAFVAELAGHDLGERLVLIELARRRVEADDGTGNANTGTGRTTLRPDR
jgi:archaellum component FlaD/FlaE